MLYAVLLESMNAANWWRGAACGLVHALFVLAVGMPLLPGIHPRMVSEYYGPTPNRRLQPPAFMALNYGRQTPLVALVAHLLYGAIVGISMWLPVERLLLGRAHPLAVRGAPLPAATQR